MKHATPAALDQLDPLLAQLRGLEGLAERSRGVFYRKGRAFLHFHEDPKGLFADVRDASGSGFERIEVTTAEGQVRLAALARARLSSPATSAGPRSRSRPSATES